MTFKIQTKNTSEWKLIVNFLTKLVDKATFTINDGGISLVAMDTAHVSMADLSMPSSVFEKFETDSEQKFTISLETFSKALQRASSNDACILYSNQAKSLIMSLSGSYDREYTLALESEDIKDAPKPDIEYSADIAMKSYVFDNIINDVDAVSTNLVVQSKDGNLEFLGKDDSAGNKVIVTLDSANAGVDSMKLGESEFKVQFSLKYLSDIMSVGKETDSIWVNIAEGKPLRIGFKIGSTSTLVFYLAPRKL